MKCRFHITNKLIYINLANMRALRSAVISRGYTNFPFPMSALRGSAGCARAVVLSGCLIKHIIWLLIKCGILTFHLPWQGAGRERERGGVCVGVVMLRRCCNISQSSQSYNKSVMLCLSCTKGNRRQKFCTLSRYVRLWLCGFCGTLFGL